MKVASVPSLIALVCVLLGCGGSPDPTIRPDIARLYEEFYELSPIAPSRARAKLEAALAADPENAYTHYLIASTLAGEDLGKTLEWVVQGNAQPHTIVYVSVAPPEDPMQTLFRIRQLGMTAQKAKALSDEQPTYFSALRSMGERVAKSLPTTALSVINGAGVIRVAFEAEQEYWESLGDPEKAQEVATYHRQFAAWNRAMQEALKNAASDLVREAGGAAGMNEEELALYAAGKDIGDTGKQARANEAKERLYKAEVETLERWLTRMPKVVAK
jgi:hypothetical protein